MPRNTGHNLNLNACIRYADRREYEAATTPQQEKRMATATNGTIQQPKKLSADERKMIQNGLGMLQTSLERSQKAAKGDSIRAAYAAEAAQVSNLYNRITTGELDL